MSMEITLQTTIQVYLQGKECLHVLSKPEQLRVRWMRNGVWMLRWDAGIDATGAYIDTFLDGEIARTLNNGLMDQPHSDMLFQAMKDASTRLPLYPNPDIVRELEWFVLDDPVPASGAADPLQ